MNKDMSGKRASVESASVPVPGELILYSGKDGQMCMQARLAADTLWLTQKQMAELFGVQPPAINKHLKNIFETGELIEESVVSILENTTAPCGWTLPKIRPNVVNRCS